MNMELFEKYSKSMKERDVGAYVALLHDDCIIVSHKSGDRYSKDEWVPMVTGIMANEKFIQESSRCVYENDDIMIEHSFMSYPDDSREAVMMIAMKKDGLIIHVETGATTLS